MATTYYVYDAAGSRVRKVTEGQTGSPVSERIYLGGLEIYREYASGGAIALERQSLHVVDSKQVCALVETTVVDTSTTAPQPTLSRYQFTNRLGSVALELDAQGQIISYEEYYPYGSTSYQAGRNALEVTQKRYRYTGMERDEQSGFSCHGQRYYAPWLGRWISADPSGISGGFNLYGYASANPMTFQDMTGLGPDGGPDEGTEDNYPHDAGVYIPPAAGVDTPGTWIPQEEIDHEKAILNVVASPVTFTAGVAYGVCKVGAKVVIAPGKITYYSTSYLLYQATGSDIWKDQASTYEEGANGFVQTVSHPWEATKSYVSTRGDAFVDAWDRKDFFDLGDTTGETGTELYLFAKTSEFDQAAKHRSCPLGLLVRDGQRLRHGRVRRSGAACRDGLDHDVELDAPEGIGQANRRRQRWKRQ